MYANETPEERIDKAFDFIRYVMEHPEVLDTLPDKAVITVKYVGGPGPDDDDRDYIPSRNTEGRPDIIFPMQRRVPVLPGH